MFQLSQALAQKVCSSSTLAYYNPAAKSVLRTRQNISCFLEFGPRLRIDCISVLFRVCKHLNSPLTGENESFGSVRHFHSCMSPRFTPFTSVMVTFLSRVCDNFLSHHGLTAQSWQNKLFPN